MLRISWSIDGPLKLGYHVPTLTDESFRSLWRRSAGSFPLFSVSTAESRLGHAINWEASAAAPRWVCCNWLSAPPAASLHSCNVKNFWDTPHWWVLFDCSPAWLGGISPPAIGSCAELVIHASWLLWTRAKYFFQLSIRGISASGEERGQAWRMCSLQVCWGVHSKMYIPVSCSDVHLLLEWSLLTTGSLLWLFHTWKFSSIHRWLDVVIYRYTGAGCGMCIPTPQQRISDHLFSPSGDHKILTRIYVTRSIVPRYSLVGRLFFCPPSLLIFSSHCTPFLHHPSSRRASLLSFSEHISGQLWCGNRIYKPEEQSSMITLRHVGACWVEPELLLWRSCSMSPVTGLNFSSEQLENDTLKYPFFPVFYMFVVVVVVVVQWWEDRGQNQNDSKLYFYTFIPVVRTV